MNNQEVFDKVVEHLYTQRAKAKSDSLSTCFYRLGNLKCAIGALIPDDLYHPAIERVRIGNLIGPDHLSFNPNIAALFEGVNANLLAELQWIHDGSEVNEWPEALRHTGKRYGLDISNVKDYV